VPPWDTIRDDHFAAEVDNLEQIPRNPREQLKSLYKQITKRMGREMRSRSR
jgi:hypothetical protein